ncbi:probable BOI-related E3 ubiquitin-protein ligase 3 [Punica granatum]|uniref:Uncharacterized protein n=2 Tax=Punica granatum TaxID=22663 RepID=A0A218XGT1_PUNGR|nr:probable BOI-related E3 ubiquitin-protein ligase 3 [Punica granatum]OWM83960.1 hypothetical protein CDL15_Pgr004391 [Punica granatum]PKI78688.1 hypothetical protein CRG98_000913 [Punica granatum]
MAIEAQLRPEMNIAAGFPMLGLPSSSSHHDYNGGCGFNSIVTASGHGRKRQRLDLEQLVYMQQLQCQQQRGHQNLCLVSGFHDGVAESYRKRLNSETGFDRHGEEIDHYLRLQAEGLKWLLKEQRQRQEAALLRKIESRAQSLFQQKDQELARASRKTAELQSLLAKLETENQAWQRLAQENEAMVVSLSNTLEQLRGREEEDVESCCDEVAPDRGAEVESRGVDKTTTATCCRACNHGESSVLFLPCRHLCSCKSCDAFLDRCPVCGTAKKASIEALIL